MTYAACQKEEEDQAREKSNSVALKFALVDHSLKWFIQDATYFALPCPNPKPKPQSEPDETCWNMLNVSSMFVEYYKKST